MAAWSARIHAVERVGMLGMDDSKKQHEAEAGDQHLFDSAYGCVCVCFCVRPCHFPAASRIFCVSLRA